MNKESGYITAFSIIISLLLVSVTLFNIKILDSERQFLQKHYVWFKVNVTLELSRGEVFNGLQSGSILADDHGSITYKDGTVHYKVTQISEEVYMVSFDVQLDKTGKGSGLMYYNYVNKEVIKWVVV